MSLNELNLRRVSIGLALGISALLSACGNVPNDEVSVGSAEGSQPSAEASGAVPADPAAPAVPNVVFDPAEPSSRRLGVSRDEVRRRAVGLDKVGNGRPPTSTPFGLEKARAKLVAYDKMELGLQSVGAGDETPIHPDRPVWITFVDASENPVPVRTPPGSPQLKHRQFYIITDAETGHFLGMGSAQDGLDTAFDQMPELTVSNDDIVLSEQ